MNSESRFWLHLALCGLILVSVGCASKKYVRTEMEGMDARTTERIDDVQSQVEENQTELVAQDERIDELSVTAQEALERAVAAGKLAEGKFLYETILSDDRVRFGFNQSELSPEGQMALDEFAERIMAENANVFVEIQGHTDSVGDAEYNLQLGEQRAEAVRRYLSRGHGLPLHRMSVISYGESAPIADNDTPEGRSANRRVSLVVLM